ncbi:MAG: hypothetical protein K6E51_03530 [Treponema sp.]|nr:hypothetical protein [Treponema sp.]
MILLEIKFYYYLGRKNYNKLKELIDEYLEKKGKTAKYYEYCFNYCYAINDYDNALKHIVSLINKKTLSLDFENWIIEFFVKNNILSHQYQLAAKNAMKLAHLENLSTKNRTLLLKMLDYIATQI